MNAIYELRPVENGWILKMTMVFPHPFADKVFEYAFSYLKDALLKIEELHGSKT